MAGRKLAVNTTVGGTTYEAGTVPPAEVAEQISNPKAWGDQADDAAGAAGDEGYDALKVDDLKAEIARRNEGRDEADRIPDDGKKADLVAALEADDAAGAAGA
jgi:hypothetical protein